MNEKALYQLLLSQQQQLRELTLHLQALKRMMFEHRPAFVPAFEQQLGAVESSGALSEIDAGIRRLEQVLSSNA